MVTVEHGDPYEDENLAELEQGLQNRIGSYDFFPFQEIWDASQIKAESGSTRQLLEEVKNRSKEESNVAHFLTLPGGDFLTVNLKTEEIRYWVHDDLPLGKNMIDFVTRMAWLGSPNLDGIPSSPFYDKKKKCLKATATGAVKTWHQFLQGKNMGGSR